jgi:Helix-turn-helix domain
VSVEALAWAFKRCNLEDPTAKLVLLALCNYADDNDRAWPSHGTISKITGLSKRAVQNNIKKLETHGVITRVTRERGDGSQSSCITTLNVGMAFGAIGDESGDTGVWHETTGGVSTPVQGGMAPDAPQEPSLNLQLEPSVNPSVAKRATKPTDVEIDQVFEERFWPAYPKRIGDRRKPEARAKFRSIVKKSGAKAAATMEKIIDAALRHAANWKPRIARKPADAQYIEGAVVWLNKLRWDDEQGDPTDQVAEMSMIDLANHFERRRATDNDEAPPRRNQPSSDVDDGHGLIDG